MRYRLAFLAVCLAWHAARPAHAQAPQTQARPARARRTFVPMDFEKMFTAGPLSDPQPKSTLLPAGAVAVDLTLRAAAPTVCHYSVNKNLPFDRMTPFDDREPSTSPRTKIRGLDPDPGRVNDVFIRSAAAPAEVLHLQYRSLPAPKPGFPRTANLWGSWNFMGRRLEHARRIDLWLGVHFNIDQIRRLRRLNPNCLVLTDINTVENNDVPDSYFLRDTTGRKIEVWPGAYRLNLTRPEVAEYQARYAYQRMIESNLMYDGCFFDNFMMSQRWLTHDIYDRPVQLDGDGDGKADPKDAFDKAWRAGVFHELHTWRKLMPWALTTGHSQGYPYPEIAAIFNGQGIGFETTDVIEGKKPFHQLWDYYSAWCTVTRKPAITSVESAVPDQIAYGYDYRPQQHMPASTWNFARDYYPYMRFGLAFTLMNDGFFSHELGDTDHGQDWWYDELDFKLGAPLGPARPISVSQASPRELLTNGGFEDELENSWSLWFDRGAGCRATVSRDTSTTHSGKAAARVNIEAAGRQGGIELTQHRRAIEKGKNYDLTFRARADHPLEITCISSKGSPGWDNYGLNRNVRLTDKWQAVTLTFEARRAASDARVQFLCGDETGTFWVDDVSLKERGEEIYRRDFQKGVVLLNGTRARQTITVGDGFARLKGDQAPRHQYILDDHANPGFKTTGAWHEEAMGTKEWHAIPPYYHAWNNRCHLLADSTGEASWDLDPRGPGTYSIQAWWAAAPGAKSWTGQAVYEVLADGQIVATKTLDQTRAGDEWHTIAEGLKLTPEQHPTVRIRNGGGGMLVADALHVFSAERYNDGTVTREVTLEPMDGIVLRRVKAADR
ncbi:MAG: putative glycoside hydrolase [Isosphaeraceae bacterium]